MWAWILVILKNPLTTLGVIKEFIGIVRSIMNVVNPVKSPVEQQADDVKKHEQAAAAAQANNDTSGLFGGSK